jgi:DNA end-binding protein Ku
MPCPRLRMPRSLATLTIAFGLVAIPVRLYAATLRSAELRFRWMTPQGGVVRQRLEAEPPLAAERDTTEAVGAGGAWDEALAPDDDAALPAAVPSSSASGRGAAGMPVSAAPRAAHQGLAGLPVPQPRTPQHEPEADGLLPPPAGSRPVGRSALHKGLEVEPGRFVLFTPAELEALATPARDSIDLVAFVPPHAVDPVYVEKSYYLAPAERSGRPFGLLLHALQRSERCALARWAWRGKEHPALLRAGDGVLVLHQLHSGDAVRPASQVRSELPAVSEPELQLALRLIEQSAAETFDPLQFIDPARQRILEAARRKLAGGEAIVTRPQAPVTPSAEVIDLMAALRASLARPKVEGAQAPRRPPRRTTAAPPPAELRSAPRRVASGRRQKP